VLEVVGYAFDRQGFLAEGFVPDFMASAGNPFFHRIGNYKICLGDSILGILDALAHFRHFYAVPLNESVRSTRHTDRWPYR
jgi:hypothetical protein